MEAVEGKEAEAQEQVDEHAKKKQDAINNEGIGDDYYNFTQDQKDQNRNLVPKMDADASHMPVGDGPECKKGHGVGGKLGREAAQDMGEQIRKRLLSE